MDIKGVFIRTHETRTNPKPHVVYVVEVHTSVRTWSIRQRYSAFESLVDSITTETGSTPPGHLPPKRTWTSPFTSTSDSESIQDRQQALEHWLRCIVTCQDSRWRDSRSFKEFLAIPVGKTSLSTTRTADEPFFTSQSWLTEQSELLKVTRDIHALISKRNTLIQDPSQAHSVNLEVKKKLANLVSRLGWLTKSLGDLSLGNRDRSRGEMALSEGEVRRRTDMVSHLQDECDVLGKLCVVARSAPLALRNGMTSSQPASTNSSELLGSATKPPTRVLGARAAPVETKQTRPLDNIGLLALQQEAIDAQDDRLSGLTAIIRRQKDLGIAISEELAIHNEILEDIDRGIDHTSAKLGEAKHKFKRLDGGS